MNSPMELLHSVSERLQSNASVKNVFGEPITVGDKTVIPVARIRYGFGAGGGMNAKASEHGGPPAQGGGGGGGIDAKPAGIVEISPAETRFIAFADRKRLAMATAAGFLMGVAFACRRKR